MDINKLIKEAHEMAVKKGFWDCPDDEKDYCTDCNLYNNCTNEYREDSGTCDLFITKNANIPEKLMLIVSELGEAQEALRKNKHADWKVYYDLLLSEKNEFGKYNNLKVFENNIKDTFEDEIADVYIRLADLCGYLKLNPITSIHNFPFSTNNISDMLFQIVSGITDYNYIITDTEKNKWSGKLLNSLDTLCKLNNIDIDKHITAKMAYNATRPYKHGKAF